MRKVIPYSLHGQIDGGLIAMTAAMPRLVNIESDREARFFARQAVAKSAITAMTNFQYAGSASMESDADEEARLGI